MSQYCPSRTVTERQVSVSSPTNMDHALNFNNGYSTGLQSVHQGMMFAQESPALSQYLVPMQSTQPMRSSRQPSIITQNIEFAPPQMNIMPNTVVN